MATTLGNVAGIINAARERNFDRSFILIRKGCCGKSTLGNLLLGKRRHFKAHVRHEAAPMTTEIHTGEDKFKACQIYKDVDPNEMIKIQIIDQLGSNDTSFNQGQHCKFITQCIALSKAEMSANFIILIDMSSPFHTAEEVLTIFNLAELLSDCSYSFFPNAIIVFTHADKIDKDLNQEKLENYLQEKLKNKFTALNDLIDLVNKRYIFINSDYDNVINRYVILKELFSLSRCSLNLYINGNNGFTGEELKQILKKKDNNFQKESVRYNLNYQFNPDLNIFESCEIRKIEEDISDKLDKLSGIGTGTSAMILLISLEELFNEEIYNLIVNLPMTYNLGKKFKDDFWNYACILFKVSVDRKDFVKRNIVKNRKLKSFVGRVNSRYAWVTNETNAEVCHDRIINLVKMVKLHSEGKNFTDTIVLAEMKKAIRESAQFGVKLEKFKMVGDIKEERIQNQLPFYVQEKDREDEKEEVLIGANGFIRNKNVITLLKGYFLLSKINQEIAKQFREQFRGKEEIPNEDYAKFCIEAIHRMLQL